MGGAPPSFKRASRDASPVPKKPRHLEKYPDMNVHCRLCSCATGVQRAPFIHFVLRIANQAQTQVESLNLQPRINPPLRHCLWARTKLRVQTCSYVFPRQWKPEGVLQGRRAVATRAICCKGAHWGDRVDKTCASQASRKRNGAATSGFHDNTAEERGFQCALVARRGADTALPEQRTNSASICSSAPLSVKRAMRTHDEFALSRPPPIQGAYIGGPPTRLRNNSTAHGNVEANAPCCPILKYCAPNRGVRHFRDAAFITQRSQPVAARHSNTSLWVRRQHLLSLHK